MMILATRLLEARLRHLAEEMIKNRRIYKNEKLFFKTKK